MATKKNTNGSQTSIPQPTPNTGAAKPLPPVRFDDVMRPAPQPQRPGKPQPQPDPPPQNTPPAA